MTQIKTQAIARNLKMSPRKVRLLVDLVKGMDASKALIQLRFSTKAAAKPVLKLLQSAIANAKHNYSAKEETLKVTGGFVNGGAAFKRWTPKAMGRATPIRHRTSHITLVLEGEGELKNKENKEDVKTVEKGIPTVVSRSESGSSADSGSKKKKVKVVKAKLTNEQK